MSAPLADIITDDVLQEARLDRQLRATLARSGGDPEAVLAEERIVSIACEGLRAGWVTSLTIHAPTPAEVDVTRMETSGSRFRRSFSVEKAASLVPLMPPRPRAGVLSSSQVTP